MKRLNIFAKGNLDVHDSLHSLRLGGEVRWNGINELVRERNADFKIRVRHETSGNSEALLNAAGEIPDGLAERSLPLDPFTLKSQFGRTLFECEADAYILSIQADIQFKVTRHRRAGYFFSPYNVVQWSPADREWLRAEFELGELLDTDRSMANFETIVSRLRAARDVPILVYNVSSIVPGETIHCHTGMDDILSTRIKRFNLALVELSQRTGISIVDVDRIVARHGAGAMKLDTTHLTEHGCRAVAEEVLRILEDYGCLPSGMIAK